MNPIALITRKRDKGRLSAEEINRLIDGFVRDEVPDYQMSALAMAIFFRGMDATETAALVQAMLGSGARLTWPPGFGPIVDKHSTGGVGDKTSLILAPLLASCGLRVPMLSGRGLGTTGGTLDKLESIPGFRTNLSSRDILQIVDQVGCVITGTTADLVPADRKLYALRDVTGTVPSIPLICASIMSKKLAENLDALVLDVKFGSGAFLKSLDDARELARLMVDTGEQMGTRTVALLSDMNQPLGRMVGNALEVLEAVDVMRGEGPPDLNELCIALAVELLVAARIDDNPLSAASRARKHLTSGRALQKFHEMIAYQGGTLESLPASQPASDVLAAQSGFVASIDAEKLGMAVIELGGGRRKMGDTVDHAVGIEVLVRLGDEVRAGEPLTHVFASSKLANSNAHAMIASAFTFSPHPPPATPLIVERVVTAQVQLKAKGDVKLRVDRT